MKYLKKKDNIIKIFFYKKELDYIRLKYLINNFNLTKEQRYFFFWLFSDKNRSSYVYSKNRCSITNRSKGIMNIIHGSRIVFRKYASEGYLTGIKKSSW